ncbi:MAG: lipopolysaccharide heptosyltransferase II [Gammaproteobacteria bacterium]
MQRGVNPVDLTEAILVVGPSWVGDMVMAQSFFMELKKRYPDSVIDVLAPGWVLPLLARMPEVRRGIESPFRHGELALRQRYRLGRSLRGQYGRAFVLPNSLKSALIPFWAGIRQRIGYRGEFRYGLLNEPRKLDQTALPRTVERFVALAADSGAVPTGFDRPELDVDADSQRATLDKFGLAGVDQPILALCPGAEYGPAKCWPAEHFAEVARTKHQQGWRVWIFGSAADQSVADQINRLAKGVCENLAGRTTLAQACDLLAMADAVVTNDSGLMHVAAASGRRVFCLYGSSDPGFTPPLSEQATIFSLGLSCSPCFKRECPLGHLKCLQDLKPAQILAAMG